MPETKKIDKQAILNRRQKMPKEEYQIGEQKVWFRGLKGREWEDWKTAASDPEKIDPNLVNAKIIQMSMCEEDGSLVFNETDIMALGEMWMSDIKPMLEIIFRLNGIGASSYEAILKNLVKILGIDGLFDLLASINVRCPNCSKDTATTH